jgi:hypothetical protein
MALHHYKSSCDAVSVILRRRERHPAMQELSSCDLIAGSNKKYGNWILRSSRRMTKKSAAGGQKRAPQGDKKKAPQRGKKATSE